MEEKVIKTLKETQDFLSKFNSEVFALDTETTDVKFYSLEIEGISLCDGNSACYIDFINNTETGTILHYLKCNLFNVCNMVILQNAVFDMKVLYKYGIFFDEIEIFDTMVAHHLIDENSQHGLKFLAKKYLGKDSKSYEETEKLGHQSKEFYQYAINDAVWTWELSQIFKKDLESQDLIKLFREIEMPFLKVLLEMEVNGIDVDKELADKQLEDIQEDIFRLQEKMHHELGLKFDFQFRFGQPPRFESKINLNSNLQLGSILFDKYKLPVVEYTAGGARAVGKVTIEKYKDHPFVSLLYKYKLLRKLLTSFFNPLATFIDGDGKIRPSFRDTGTKTGRLSSNSPNIQQLPSPNKIHNYNVRSCFIAPKGYKMLTCDYSGQELRVLAQITQEPVLIETFKKGKDMHLSTANDFFDLGIPEEALYSTHKDCEMYKKKFKEDRKKAKIINFGMAYGKGAFGFSKDFNISEEEAQGLLDKYFAALPKVKESIDDCHKSVKRKGYVTSMTGRRRHFEKTPDGWYPKKAFRQSFNFLIQGYSADMIRMAGIATSKIAKANPNWGLKTVATVHDEIVYIVKDKYASTAGQYIKEAFENVVKWEIPIVADIEIGTNYGNSK